MTKVKGVVYVISRDGCCSDHGQNPNRKLSATNRPSRKSTAVVLASQTRKSPVDLAAGRQARVQESERRRREQEREWTYRAEGDPERGTA